MIYIFFSNLIICPDIPNNVREQCACLLSCYLMFLSLTGKQRVLPSTIPPGRTFSRWFQTSSVLEVPAVLHHLHHHLCSHLIASFPGRKIYYFIFSPQHQTAALAGISHVRLQIEAKCDWYQETVTFTSILKHTHTHTHASPHPLVTCS